MQNVSWLMPAAAAAALSLAPIINARAMRDMIPGLSGDTRPDRIGPAAPSESGPGAASDAAARSLDLHFFKRQVRIASRVELRGTCLRRPKDHSTRTHFRAGRPRAAAGIVPDVGR